MKLFLGLPLLLFFNVQEYVTKLINGWIDLQVEVAQYINTDVRGVPLSAPATKPLSGFRGNLSGKRVEYTGRTVISPDPNLKITEVAVPILMAQILTYPERVSYHNTEKLRQCVRNGPKKYPGAKYIRQPDGTEISLKFSSRKRHADELKFGYIVDRHLEDGDVILFNRQPSLHRMSIMCHRARIMPWRTLRFNESVCNPYNADFDGDEMNMHVPQTEEARTEALMLMGVQNNLCTPKNGEILVASTQDFLTSSFLITRKDTFYDRASFSLMCSYMGDGMDQIDLPTPALLKVTKRISTPIISAKLEHEDNAKEASLAKARIEKTLLGQVAKSIKIVMSARLASIVITLDMEIIQASRLCTDAYRVKESILQTPRIKLKDQHVKVLNSRKLEVVPQTDRSKLHFELHTLKNKLPSVVVTGITTIERVVINSEEKKDSGGGPKYLLFAEGTGLLGVMGTEGVNGYETKSNHIMEVQQTLGIEAARSSIIDEIKHTMSSHGMTIDIRHMMLLADLMTFKGEVLGITRHGVQKMKDSVLMLASFEKTADHLFNASVNGRDDKIEGVSECIIMGIPMQLGTGMLKVRQRVQQVELNYGLDPILS
nr:DNA-directed RNA polymerase III subunit 1-like [Coffea arabica]